MRENFFVSDGWLFVDPSTFPKQDARTDEVASAAILKARNWAAGSMIAFFVFALLTIFFSSELFLPLMLVCLLGWVVFGQFTRQLRMAASRKRMVK